MDRVSLRYQITQSRNNRHKGGSMITSTDNKHLKRSGTRIKDKGTRQQPNTGKGNCMKFIKHLKDTSPQVVKEIPIHSNFVNDDVRDSFIKLKIKEAHALGYSGVITDMEGVLKTHEDEGLVVSGYMLADGVKRSLDDLGFGQYKELIDNYIKISFIDGVNVKIFLKLTPTIFAIIDPKEPPTDKGWGKIFAIFIPVDGADIEMDKVAMSKDETCVPYKPGMTFDDVLNYINEHQDN